MGPAVDLIGTVPLFERLDAPLCAGIEAITAWCRPSRPGAVASGRPAGVPVCLWRGRWRCPARRPMEPPPGGGATRRSFVLASVMTRLPYLLTARTVTGCRLLAIHGDGLLDMVEHEAPLANTLLRSVSREFRTMVSQVRDLKLRTAAQRLGCYLLARVKDGEATKADFRLPFDKGLLAARLGCRQENLSRAFAALRACGVETHGSRVILHDIARLKALAVPDDLGDSEAL